MRLLRSGRMLRGAMLLVAVFALFLTVMDWLNIWPQAALRFAPFLLVCIVLLMLDDNLRLRRLRRDLPSNSPASPSAPESKTHKPNKKRQPNPQPEYRAIAWHGLTLRSYSEVKIAKALDNKGILFLADPKIRLNTENHRQTREVDFLIQHQGKWGILEVDGPHHQQAAASDQWRDARFTEQGILVARFPADLCYRQPDTVVERFLAQLATYTPSAPNP